MANIILNGKTVVTQTGNDEPLIGGNVLMHSNAINTALSGATFPAGHVIQSKFVYFDLDQTIGNGSTTGSTWTNIGAGVSGKEFSIPMTVNSGNIVFGMGLINMSTNNYRYSAIRIYADGGNIAAGALSSARTPVHSGPGITGDTNEQYHFNSFPFSFTYDPQTTNSVIYSIKAANTLYPAAYTHINKIHSDSDAAWSHRGYSHFMLMEIAQ